MKNLLKTAKSFRPVDPSGSPPGLPVYRLIRSDHSIFYTPGLVAVATGELGDSLQDSLLGKSFYKAPKALVDLKETIVKKAGEALKTYMSFQDDTFEPECLTLYFHNRCNLVCDYCLIDRRKIGKEQLRPETALEGAKIVAESCLRKGLPLTEVFHGWGEPTYDFHLLQGMVKVVDEVAKKAGLKQYRYIATNGVMSSRVAHYLCHNFDLVGLSCDGPEDIQDAQRSLEKSGKSSEFVKRTASILKAEDRPISVRTTITRKTMPRQEEIADYIIQELKPDEIHFEPVYRAKVDGFKFRDAQEFVEHFQSAKELASEQHVKLIFSGSRLDTIHGPYCNVFRNVLNLVHGQKATACFAEANIYPDVRYVIGESRGECFEIDREKLQELKITLSRSPKSCKFCFNQYHCVRTCPDECVGDTDNSEQKDCTATFRCQVQLLSAAQQILSCAKQIIDETNTTPFLGWKRKKDSIVEVNQKNSAT